VLAGRVRPRRAVASSRGHVVLNRPAIGGELEFATSTELGIAAEGGRAFIEKREPVYQGR